MSKSAFIRVRVEQDLKAEAEQILHELGITPSQAITMLYKNIMREHAWPLKLKIPNKQTRQTLDETDQGIDITSSEDFADFCRKTGIKN